MLVDWMRSVSVVGEGLLPKPLELALTTFCQYHERTRSDVIAQAVREFFDAHVKNTEEIIPR